MLTIEKTHTTCPQEEHDQCACAIPKVIDFSGSFIYCPYIFEVTPEVLAEFGGEA